MEIDEVTLSEREGLVRLLAALTEQPEDVAGWLIDRGRFELDVSGTAERCATLEEMLTTAGLRFRSAEQTFSEAGQSLRWTAEGNAIAKLGTTAAMGGAALIFSVPLVPVAAVLTLIYLAVRSVRILPHRVSVRAASLERTVGIDAAALAEAHAACKRVTDPSSASRLRDCVRHFAVATSVLRAGGAHLREPDLGRVDAQLQQLLRQTIKLTLSADRLRGLGAEANGSGSAKLRTARAQTDARLDEIQSSLVKLSEDLHELQTAELRAKALSSSRRVLLDLRIGVDAALEMADLAAELSRKEHAV